MSSSLGADLLVALHLAFVVFAVLGGWLALRWLWVAWLHVPAAAWAALIEFQGWICPLTPLEQRLRVMAGEEGYEGGFVAHYIEPVLYPANLTADAQAAFGLFVVAMNLAAYGAVLARRRARKAL